MGPGPRTPGPADAGGWEARPASLVPYLLGFAVVVLIVLRALLRVRRVGLEGPRPLRGPGGASKASFGALEAPSGAEASEAPSLMRETGAWLKATVRARTVPLMAELRRAARRYGAGMASGPSTPSGASSSSPSPSSSSSRS